MLYPDELQAQCLEIRPTWQEYFGLLPSALRAVMKSNHVQIAPGDLVEPATLGLEGRCSIRMSYRRSIQLPEGCIQNLAEYILSGRGREITKYIRVFCPAGHASHVQNRSWRFCRTILVRSLYLVRSPDLPICKSSIHLVGVERFELPTSCSQSRRATRLRYTPILTSAREPDNTAICPSGQLSV